MNQAGRRIVAGNLHSVEFSVSSLRTHCSSGE
jgi:hypothetical protein